MNTTETALRKTEWERITILNKKIKYIYILLYLYRQQERRSSVIEVPTKENLCNEREHILSIIIQEYFSEI